jgi:uncharacterized protein (TIGR03435 family)
VPRVQNHTGLKGVYDFTLEYVGGTPFPSGAAHLEGGTSGNERPSVGTAADPIEGYGGGPTVFTALEKQAGLRLKKVKDVDVRILVVDHVDKIPTDN